MTYIYDSSCVAILLHFSRSSISCSTFAQTTQTSRLDTQSTRACRTSMVAMRTTVAWLGSQKIGELNKIIEPFQSLHLRLVARHSGAESRYQYPQGKIQPNDDNDIWKCKLSDFFVNCIYQLMYRLLQNQEQGSLECIRYQFPLSIQLEWRMEIFNVISIYT